MRLGVVDQQLPLPAIADAIVRASAASRWAAGGADMTADSELVHTAAQLLDARIGLKPDALVPAATRPRAPRCRRCQEHRPRAASSAPSPGDESLLDELLDRVTVQETAFFRHPEQFETLVRRVLPAIDGPLRAWSAACANGQEAYSLAMLVQRGRPIGIGARLGHQPRRAAIEPPPATTTIGRCAVFPPNVGASTSRSTGAGWQANQSLRDHGHRAAPQPARPDPAASSRMPGRDVSQRVDLLHQAPRRAVPRPTRRRDGPHGVPVRRRRPKRCGR